MGRLAVDAPLFGEQQSKAVERLPEAARGQHVLNSRSIDLSSRSPGWLIGCQLCLGLGSGHALGAEHAAALELPVFVLLQQHCIHQPGDHCAAKSSSRCDVDALKQIGAPGIAPVLSWEVPEGQHVISGLEQWPLAEFVIVVTPLGSFPQRAGQAIPVRFDFSGLVLGEHRAQRGGNHALGCVLGTRCSSLRA